LLDEASALDPEFEQHADRCEDLTAQFWAQHYPGGDLTDVGKDYDQLRRQAGELINLILKAVPRVPSPKT
jgi:hypothetical protein